MRDERSCEGSMATHYEGCACHENRRDKEIADLRAQLAVVTKERDAALKRIEELKRVEWVKMPFGNSHFLTCPWCYRTHEEGHAPDCPRRK